MSQITTTRTRNPLSPGVVRLVKRTRGMAAEIARTGGFQRAFVCEVLTGRRPPSARFIRALSGVLGRHSDLLMGAAAGVELPGVLEQAGAAACSRARRN